MSAYPIARRDDLIETYHGTPVADPYRWLEDPQDPETVAFVTTQNAISQAYLAAIPERDRFRDRLTELWNFSRYGAPHHRNRRYFYTYNNGLQNQPEIYVSHNLDADGQALIDPNTLSSDGTIAITSLVPSPNGHLLAYNLAASGSDWQVIRVRDAATGEDLSDRIDWCKFTEVAWLPDSSAFYYARYPSPLELAKGPLAAEPGSTHQRVFLHQLGTDQQDDRLVYARPDARDLGFRPELSQDGRYLVLTVWEGTDHRNRIYYRPLDSSTADFVRLLDDMDARYDFLGNVDDRFYFLTNAEAPNGRIIAIDVAHSSREEWLEIVPEQSQALDFARIAGEEIILVRLWDASHQVERYDLAGQSRGEIPLPEMGQVLELHAQQGDPEAFLLFTSFLRPPTAIRYDSRNGKTETVWEPAPPFDPADYVTRQKFVISNDGTRVPVFLTHKRDLTKDGQRPTLLYGYGGFNVNVLPAFSPARILWLELGGIFASANLRGGQEYGETWHAAGMLGKKQNVFDDFIAVAERLVSNGYTNSEHLAIDGRSNGGLLTAATMLQRPDLFGAVHSAVPVIDMLRYHRFTAGRYWTPEYGNAETDPEQFRFLRAYSPLHNVRAGVIYPPLLITTADTDDRVVPMHSLKFGATLQAAAEYEMDVRHPILLRIETRAGHGPGKPTSKLVEESADIYAFLWANVGNS